MHRKEKKKIHYFLIIEIYLQAKIRLYINITKCIDKKKWMDIEEKNVHVYHVYRKIIKSSLQPSRLDSPIL